MRLTIHPSLKENKRRNQMKNKTLLQKRIQVFFCNFRNFYRKSLFFIVTDYLIDVLQIIYQIIENIWRKIYF